MISEAIDFRYLLIDNYKRLKLSENELAVLFVIDFLIDQGNPFVTADYLSLKMTLDVKTIDSILAGLLKKDMIEYVSRGKKTVTTLNPLKNKLYREFQITFEKEQKDSNNKDAKERLENIYAKFEELLQRNLTPVEFSKIREWIQFGYSDEDIINALKDALAKGKKSLRSVDKILLQQVAREDIDNEGMTTIDDKWDKNIEETIRIAKIPWLKK